MQKKKYLIVILMFTVLGGLATSMTNFSNFNSLFNVVGEANPSLSKLNFTLTHAQGSWLTGEQRTTFSQRSLETYATTQAQQSKDKTQFFIFESLSSRLNVQTGTFFALDSNIVNAWNVLEPSGKLSNRVGNNGSTLLRTSNIFYLTNVTMVVAKRTPLQTDIDNATPVSIELEKTIVSSTTNTDFDEETGEEETTSTFTVNPTNPAKKWVLRESGVNSGASYIPTVRFIGESTLSSNLITLTQDFSYSEQLSTFRFITSHQTYIQSISFEYSIDYSDC
jgi:hypothetical protein